MCNIFDWSKNIFLRNLLLYGQWTAVQVMKRRTSTNIQASICLMTNSEHLKYFPSKEFMESNRMDVMIQQTAITNHH